MNDYDELYQTLIDGNIQISLTKLCRLVKENKDDIILNAFINSISFIASNMDISLTLKWEDLLNNIHWFITNDVLEIDKILIIAVKICILAKQINISKDIYIQSLRKIVITSLETKNLNSRIFDEILPHANSESYPVACQIIASLEKLFVSCINLSSNDKEVIAIANKIRLCFEYVIRKKVYIETTSVPDTDNIWFILELSKILANNNSIEILKDVVKYNWNHKLRKNRIGLVIASSFLVIVSHKMSLCSNWNEKENILFKKVMLMSSEMLSNTPVSNIKRVIKKPKQVVNHLEIFLSYTPQVINNSFTDYVVDKHVEKKTIRY